jgi:hypothetical protein
VFTGPNLRHHPEDPALVARDRPGVVIERRVEPFRESSVEVSLAEGSRTSAKAAQREWTWQPGLGHRSGKQTSPNRQRLRSTVATSVPPSWPLHCQGPEPRRGQNPHTRGPHPSARASCETSHSAMARRVQYLFNPAGGPTWIGARPCSATNTRRPLRDDVGVSAPE